MTWHFMYVTIVGVHVHRFTLAVQVVGRTTPLLPVLEEIAARVTLANDGTSVVLTIRHGGV